MYNLFGKGRFVALLALAALSTTNTLMADYYCCEPLSCNRFYIGGFGGGIYSDSPRISQYGTAFFEEEILGPLSIIAEGRLNKTSTGFGGVQVGYEWNQPTCSSWSLSTAGELEAFFFSAKKKGHLINQTVIGLDEHDFYDTFRTNSSVILANVVLSLNNDCLFGLTPYVGGGLGAARISFNKADSLQVEPQEPGINHFNSRRNDSTWAFAAQAKVGLRYNICENFNIFAEYRYVFIDNNNYIFGATNYPTHVPTTAWNVRVKNASYNAFAVGLQYNL